MQGFYAIYYTGADGYAAFGLLLHEGKIYGIDANGGTISGTYTERQDGGVDLALTFSLQPGLLVTGQDLSQPMTMTANVTISAATLAGDFQAVDLPIGRVNIRVQKVLSLSAA